MADRVISYAFRASFTNLTAGLAAAGASVNAFGTKLTALDANGAKMRAGLTTLGGAAGKVGLVAAAGLGAAVVASANFEAAMSKVQAATGESADAMGDLRAAALKAGADTAFSASEAAAGVENLAKAGVSTADILGGGLSGALDLAAAGGLDVATAAEAAATAMTQFKLSGEDVPHIADLLAAGAGRAQGEVTDLSAALNQSGLVAGQMGLTIEETTGTLAAFASAGLLGSDAGTSLKTAMLRLANPSKEASAAMEEFGINAYDAQGNMRPMAEIAEQLKVGFEGQSQATRDAALATIFGSDVIRAAILYSQGADGVTDWTNKVNDQGYAAEVAATKLDNLKGDLEAFKGSLETALIGTGDGSQGALRKMTQGATDLVNAFNDLPPVAKQVTGGLLAITAVTGGALWFGSKVIGGIASTKLALDQLGISAGLTGGKLRGLSVAAGAATALLVLGEALDSVAESSDRADPNVEGLTRNLLNMGDSDAMQGIADDIGDLGHAIDTLDDPSMMKNIADFYDSIPMGLGGFTDNIIPGLQSAKQESREAAASIKGLDEALAGLVAQGASDEASAALEGLADAYNLTGAQQRNLLQLMPAYREALDAEANAATLAGIAFASLPDNMPPDSLWASFYGDASAAAGATDNLAGAAYRAAAATNEEALALRDSVKAMNQKRDATLAAFDAETQYRQALKAAREQGDKNNAGIRGSSEAARENRSVLSGLAAAWNNQSDAVKNNAAKFRESRSAFIDAATAMGVPERAAKALADQILDIPKSRAIKISAETAAANAAIEETRRRLAAFNGARATVYIDTIRNTIGTGVGPAYNAEGLASGGPVSKGHRPASIPTQLTEALA